MLKREWDIFQMNRISPLDWLINQRVPQSRTLQHSVERIGIKRTCCITYDCVVCARIVYAVCVPTVGAHSCEVCDDADTLLAGHKQQIPFAWQATFTSIWEYGIFKHLDFNASNIFKIYSKIRVLCAMRVLCLYTQRLRLHMWTSDDVTAKDKQRNEVGCPSMWFQNWI